MLFGKLEARRHLISGSDWAIAGAANAAPTSPTPPPAIRLRRRIAILPRCPASAAGCPIYNRCGLEIAPPKVKGADADADQHQAEGVLRINQKPERDSVAFGNAGNGQIGRGADQGAIAPEAGTQ